MCTYPQSLDYLAAPVELAQRMDGYVNLNDQRIYHEPYENQENTVTVQE